MCSIQRLAITALMLVAGGLGLTVPTAAATTGTTDGLQWATSGSPASAVTITGHTAAATNGRTTLALPSVIDVDAGPNVQNLPVTVIGYQAIQGLTTIQRLIIPDSVTTIDTRAFAGNENLEELTIGNGVTTIGMQAFYQGTPSTSLTRLTLGDHVTTIGDMAFAGAAGVRVLTLPSSVRTIGAAAFVDMPGLERVTVDEGVTNIGTSAFLVGNPTVQPPLVFVIRGSATPFPAYGIDGHSGGLRVLRYRNAIGPWEGNLAFDGATFGYITDPPPAPTAIAGAESATITVTTPARGETPTSYTVTSSPGAGTCTITGAAGSCTMRDLAAGTQYVFTAIAHSTDATPSDPSEPSVAVTPTALPPSGASAGTGTDATPSSHATDDTAATSAPTLRLSNPRVTRSAIHTVFTATGPGWLRQTARLASGPRDASTSLCRASRRITKAGIVTVTCRLTQAARRRAAVQPLLVTLTTSFTPIGGSPSTNATDVRIPRSAR